MRHSKDSQKNHWLRTLALQCPHRTMNWSVMLLHSVALGPSLSTTGCPTLSVPMKKSLTDIHFMATLRAENLEQVHLMVIPWPRWWLPRDDGKGRICSCSASHVTLNKCGHMGQPKWLNLYTLMNYIGAIHLVLWIENIL